MVAWYFKLKGSPGDTYPSLFSVVKRNNCGVILAKGKLYKGKYSPSYTNFRNIVDASIFLDSISNRKELAFHEVILGERPQKLRFDIDLDGKRFREYKNIMKKSPNYYKSLISTGSEILHKLISAIIGFFKTKWDVDLIPLKDIIITTSHGKDKYSVHVIITSRFFDSSEHSKTAFEEIIIHGNLSEFVDNGIIDPMLFGRTASFRLLGSIKFIGDKSNRRKILMDNFVHEGVTYNLNIKDYFRSDNQKNKYAATRALMKATMIGYVDESTRLEIAIKEKIHEEILVNSQEIEDCLEIIFTIFPKVYSCGEINGNRIWLTRLKKSYCEMCKRDHEGMSGMVIIYENRYSFHCGRNKKLKMIIDRNQIISKDLRSRTHDNDKVEFPTFVCPLDEYDYDSDSDDTVRDIVKDHRSEDDGEDHRSEDDGEDHRSEEDHKSREVKIIKKKSEESKLYKDVIEYVHLVDSQQIGIPKTLTLDSRNISEIDEMFPV